MTQFILIPGYDDAQPGKIVNLAVNVANGGFQTSTPINPSTLVTGQVIIAVTGTAVNLPTNALVNGVIVKSKSTNNAAGQTVGGATVTNAVTGAGNGYILDPGEAASFGVTNTSAVWVNGTLGDIFSFEGN